MKKKITAGVASLMLAFPMMNMLPANAQTQSWKEAYLSVVQTKEGIEDVEFALEKIDDDDIPELCITCFAYPYDETHNIIYSYSDNGLTQITEYIEKTQHMGCNKEENTVVMRYYGKDKESYRITRIENGVPEILYDYGYYDTEDDRIFYFNGEETIDYQVYKNYVYGTYSQGLDEYYGVSSPRYYPYDETVALLTGETSGTYENISWNLSDDGTLTVTGEGDMPDFSVKSSGLGSELEDVEFSEGKECPWYDVRNLIERVDIDKRFTTIGESSFMNMDYVTELDLHEGITEISYEAFLDCDALKNVVIPSTVTLVGGRAFESCGSIEGIVVPESVTKIYYWAFDNLSLISFRHILIMNKDCDIDMFEDTIYNDTYENDVIILGQEGSTAQTYAETFERNFCAYQYGDVDFDGIINAMDASALLTEYARKSTKNPAQFTCVQEYLGDVDRDSYVDSSDASKVLAYYAYTATGGTGTMEEFLK